MMNHTIVAASHLEAQIEPPKLVQLTRRRGMSEAAFAQLVAQLGGRRAGVVVIDESPGLYAETLAESFPAVNRTRLPDCQTCGACCAYFHQVAVLDGDATPRRLAWAVWDTEDVAGPKTYWLRREPHRGHCIALKGSVGEQSLCAIYELRPNSCKAFEAGSDRCRAVRRAYGLEPPLSETERGELAKRAEADIGGDELSQLEALAGRAAASFHGREKISLLVEMIDYHRERLAEIVREAQRLHALLANKGITTAAANGARHVEAINQEARAVTSALAGLPVTGCAEPLDEAATEKMNRALLAATAQSRTALNRASRWLLALGEVVFTTFEMDVGL